MLLQFILKHLIKHGTLTLIDHSGKKYVFAGTDQPQITIRSHSKRFERRLCYTPILALGEGFMDDEYSIEGGTVYDLLTLFAINSRLTEMPLLKSLTANWSQFAQFMHRHNPIHISKNNVAHHYDLRRELYELFLDRDMQYSCAYFRDLDDTLETAQLNKKRHLAAKLRLKPGQKVLDIGCGWGGLAIYIAQETGAQVTGLTLSEEQLKVATARAEQAGLSDRVKFYLRDYRQETGKYDRIVSVGMFEHVGVKHYREFFDQVYSLLDDKGIALLHSIGCSEGPSAPNPWLEKYIFPGGYCPALSETIKEIEPAMLHVTDIEILHQHYAETLRHWHTRFMKNIVPIKKMMGERFCKMWEFYLASCEVAFRERGYMVFQIQMVRNPAVAQLTREYIYEWENAHFFSEPAKAKPVKRKKRA
jgi:cyclopropane-fatty-acyl-phospholipid synthase